uniref:At1g61320/AtMIF1 LRR domain-containing protein n=1 Tax=Setaria viridis TaxID=4556 RepID=A0A4U6VYF8_SETVI|nr:hypothetical protein SEVIR_2G272200v2 [Setaria viridis]TKW33944.1 hypothetical protein SEVIR_2G272200v2 [Setaria viridis]
MRRRQHLRRHRTQARDGSVVSVATRKGLPCGQDGKSRGGKRTRYSRHTIPEVRLLHIHSLLPLRDAARAASVSRAFVNSWRCHPNLYFSMKTLGLNATLHGHDKTEDKFIKIIYHILKMHSGSGLKTFGLEIYGHYNSCHLDSWLHLALTSGLEELILKLGMPNYNFPCSLLPGKSRDSIRNLCLSFCTFRPTARLSLRSLKKLYLNSFALERLELLHCSDIFHLKIPYVRQRLSHLEVKACHSLKVTEIKAPNLSTFLFKGNDIVQHSLGEACQVTNLYMSCYDAIHFARVDLPLIAPNLEILTIESPSEEVSNIAILPSTFHNLKYLDVCVPGEFVVPDYDYFSLVSFLDASPFLETFILDIYLPTVFEDPESVLGEASHMRRMAEVHHSNLKRVKITNFHPTKCLVELNMSYS